jgi:hypothetical protein
MRSSRCARRHPGETAKPGERGCATVPILIWGVECESEAQTPRARSVACVLDHEDSFRVSEAIPRRGRSRSDRESHRRVGREAHLLSEHRVTVLDESVCREAGRPLRMPTSEW